MFDTADLMKAITTIQTVTPPFIPSDGEVMTMVIEWPAGSPGAPPHRHPGGPSFGYVLEGEMRLFLQNPKQEIRLKPGETYTAVAKRPHLVTNAGKTSLLFLVLQGMGEYDYVPMV